MGIVQRIKTILIILLNSVLILIRIATFPLCIMALIEVYLTSKRVNKNPAMNHQERSLIYYQEINAIRMSNAMMEFAW